MVFKENDGDRPAGVTTAPPLAGKERTPERRVKAAGI